MKYFNAVLVLLIAPAVMVSYSAHADWINLTGAQSAPNIAEIYVNDHHVKLVLEIYVGDLDKFTDLLPDDWLKQSGVEAPPAAERLKRFSSETFQIIADKKHRLSARINKVEPRLRKERPNPFAGVINPVTGRPVPGSPEDKRVLYVELIYPFEGQPAKLTFIPPADKRGLPAVSIGFIAYHKQAPVVDYRFLSVAAKLNLDWKDPWYSRFENKALKRWQQSGLMTFLYIEPYEVRHETLVRVKDLEAWMDLKLQGGEYIEIDEFEPLKKRVGQFLLQHSNVLIDGKRLRPILDRTSFVKYSMTRTYFIDRPERMPLTTAMIGVIVTYVTENIPQEVIVTWDLFSEQVKKVPTNAVDPAGPFPSYVTREDNVLVWNNYLKNYLPPTVVKLDIDDNLIKLQVPMASLLCLFALLPVGWQIIKRRQTGKSIRKLTIVCAILIAAAILLHPFLQFAVDRPAMITARISKSEAGEILEGLLKNIYRSFDFREEEDAYDRLATSVTGDLLTDIYLQNRKSLIVTQAGGARARVKEVNIKTVGVTHDADRPLTLLFHAKWTVLGSVGHWGHIHTRKNSYEANITVEPVEGAWKITDLELLEEKRIDSFGRKTQ